MAFSNQPFSFSNPTANLISSFSSYGLSPDLAPKPDHSAPVGLIYSTYPLEAGGYATISGTSMASPHVAGAVALLLQARPNTPSQAVRGILQNSADPKVWSLSPSSGLLDHAFRQGAGLLDIDDAILSTTKISPAKIAAGEGASGPYTQKLTLENNGASDVTYNLSYVNAVSTGGTITPEITVCAFCYLDYPRAELMKRCKRGVSYEQPPAAGGHAGAHWRVRFAPQEEGQYRVCLVAKDKQGSCRLDLPAFSAVKSDIPGFIHSKPGRRILEHESGKPFVAIGECVWNCYSLQDFQENLKICPQLGMNYCRFLLPTTVPCILITPFTPAAASGRWASTTCSPCANWICSSTWRRPAGRPLHRVPGRNRV